MILTREQHKVILRRIGAIVGIVVALLLLVLAFGQCGNPMSRMNLL